MRLRFIASVIIVATVLAGAFVGRDLVESGSGGGWSHEAGEAFDAERVLFSTFERGRPNLTLLVQARIGDVDDPEVESAVLDFVARLETRPDVSQIESYWSLGRPDWMRSEDGSLAIINARLAGVSDDYATRAGNLAPVLRTVDDSVRITMGGPVMLHRDIQTAMQDAVVPIVLVALLSLALVFLALRHVVAVLLVAATSAFAVGVTLIGLYGLAQFRDVPVATVILGVISAWGLATASGYLMLSRYVLEREAGADPREAVVATVSTAGRTVAIAAAVASAAGISLWVLPTSLLRSTAYALGLAGLTAGASSIIGLGLLLAVVGVDVVPRTSRTRVRRTDRVSRLAHRRPVIVGLVLVALSVPLLVSGFGVEVGEPNVVSLGPDASSRQVAQQISARFPSDDVDALFVVSPSVVDFSSSDELTAEYAATLSQIEGVARVDSDQGTFVDGAPIDVPDAVTARHAGDQRTWLQAPIAEFGGGPVAERILDELSDVMAPFRVVIGGTAARNVATADAMAARTPIFVGIVLLVVAVLMAWLLRSVSAAVRGVVVILLMTAAGVAVIEYGFADGVLRTLLSFASDGTVAAVGPPIAWAMSVGVVAASSIFAWGAIREMFDRTADTDTASRRALAATRSEHLFATSLLIAPLLPLLVNDWRTAKLVGAAVLASGVAMLTFGRFLALPAATAVAAGRLWPVNREGEVRRVYPSTPAIRALVVQAEAEEAEEAAEAAAAEAAARKEAAEREAVAAELAGPARDVDREPATAGAAERTSEAPADADGIAPATGEAAAAVVRPESPSLVDVSDVERVESDAGGGGGADPDAAQGVSDEIVAAEAGADSGASSPVVDPAPAALEAVVPEDGDGAMVEAAVEHVVEADAAPESPEAQAQPGSDARPAEQPVAAVDDASDAAGEETPAEVAPAAVASKDVDEAADAVDASDEGESAASEPAVAEPAAAAGAARPKRRPSPGTVDVASLTASVIAAIEPTTPFTTELNSAFVANPANNLSRVMEAILRDASSRGGEEVLVYGHASRDRYRWMVVDSGPQAEKDASRARTLAEAQRFIRRVGGVVECRPEGDFTVFVVEIPMAS